MTITSATLPAAYRAALAVEHRALPLSHKALVTDADLLNEIATFLSTAWERP